MIERGNVDEAFNSADHLYEGKSSLSARVQVVPHDFGKVDPLRYSLSRANLALATWANACLSPTGSCDFFRSNPNRRPGTFLHGDPERTGHSCW